MPGSYERKIIAAIHSDKTYAVVFGIFDFLVAYPFWEYGDLLSLLEKDFMAVYKEHPNNNRTFTSYRLSAEEAICRKDRRGVADLKRIYKIISQRSGITINEAKTIMRQERRIAEMYCMPSIPGMNLYKEALNSGKEIILTADVPLPEVTVKRILKSCGYNNYDLLEVSSDTKRTKKYGAEFRHIISSKHIAPEDLISIGANYTSDYLAPKNNGIKSFYVPSAVSLMKKTSIYSYVLQMLDIDDIPFDNNHVPALRSILAQAALELYRNISLNGKYKMNETALGILLAGGDENDSIIKAAEKNQTVKVAMKSAKILTDHMGANIQTGIDIPTDYIRKYADTETFKILENYMDKKDFAEWQENREKSEILPRKSESHPHGNDIFPVGTRRRALVKLLFGR